MATPSEKLAQSLSEIKKFQNKMGIAVIKSDDISRTHRDRLVSAGFLQQVVKGWYISTRPDDRKHDGTSWYTSFWYYSSEYFN